MVIGSVVDRSLVEPFLEFAQFGYTRDAIPRSDQAAEIVTNMNELYTTRALITVSSCGYACAAAGCDAVAAAFAASEASSSAFLCAILARC